MYQLTLLGLGPGHMDYLTMEAYSALKSGQVINLRTEKHPIVDVLREEGVHFESYDSLYESSEDFESVYEGIVADILETLNERDVIYAVPGNPFVAEKAVQALVERVPQSNLRVIHGTSFLDAIVTRTKIDPVEGLKVIDALRLDDMAVENQGYLVCIQVYNTIVASDLKIWLSKLYHEEHPVTVVRGVGIPEMEVVTTMPLYTLDRHPVFDHLTSVVVSNQPQTKRYTFKGLLDIMAKLRGPEGCPWDREQTHATLMPYVLEEAYEVAEALQEDDVFKLEEELGDLLLQVVFHAQIGRENGDFSIEDVLESICGKMVHRHPHVFGTVEVESADEVLVNWESIKKAENQHQTVADTMKKFTPSLPALFRATKVQAKAAKVGFDWPEASLVFDKIAEEIDELKAAVLSDDQEAIQDELGDLLFSVVNLARKLTIDSEFSLHRATEKFQRRFEVVEGQMIANNLNMADLSIDELENAWQKAKKSEYFQK